MGDALRVAGTMSGTSLDGVDAAVIETDGETVSAFGPTAFRPYTEAERATLRAALGRWPGAPGVAEAEAVVEQAHAEALAGLAEPAEFVALHGQTLAHDPGGRGTHQAGDGARLAARLGRAVVWDFRSADVAAGGQGAPLASAYHFALARRIGGDAPVAFLNLGGVGNLTWADPRCETPQMPGALAAFDTGPASAPVDDLMRARLGQTRDSNGALAATGRAEEAVLARFLADPYFARPVPKSLDRDAFAALLPAVDHLNDADAAATLTEAVARTVAAGLARLPTPPARLLVTGGGRHNAEMMRRIAVQAGCPVAPVEEAGLDGDMLEAQAFAFLAVRVLRGLPTSFPATTGAPRPICGGRVSRPG